MEGWCSCCVSQSSAAERVKLFSYPGVHVFLKEWVSEFKAIFMREITGFGSSSSEFGHGHTGPDTAVVLHGGLRNPTQKPTRKVVLFALPSLFLCWCLGTRVEERSDGAIETGLPGGQ